MQSNPITSAPTASAPAAPPPKSESALKLMLATSRIRGVASFVSDDHRTFLDWNDRDQITRALLEVLRNLEEVQIKVSVLERMKVNA